MFFFYFWAIFFIISFHRKNMDNVESSETESESFIQFPKPDEENRPNGERWHLLGTPVPQAEMRVWMGGGLVFTIHLALYSSH